MRSAFSTLIGFFLTPGGVFVMGVLDSSLIFFLPMGLDFVVILLAARHPELVWLIPLLAAFGGVVGAGFTFWLGRKVGEHGLTRLIDERQLTRVQKKIERSAAPSIAALALIPPPFPFTPFILAGGALGLNAWRFLSALAAVKLVRYGTESALAARFGTRILGWMESTVFEVIVGVFIVLAVGGSAVSAAVLLRRRKRAD